MENKTGTVEDEKIDETGVDTQTTIKDEEKAEEKTLTQKEVDDIVKERLEREKKKLPNKEELAKYNEWKESQKTEADKQAEKDKLILEKEQTATNYKNENTALKKGVNVEEVDYVMFKVSKMDGDFEDNLDEFLKENPKYLKQQESNQTTGVRANGLPANQRISGVDAILKARHPELYK